MVQSSALPIAWTVLFISHSLGDNSETLKKNHLFKTMTDFFPVISLFSLLKCDQSHSISVHFLAMISRWCFPFFLLKPKGTHTFLKNHNIDIKWLKKKHNAVLKVQQCKSLELIKKWISTQFVQSHCLEVFTLVGCTKDYPYIMNKMVWLKHDICKTVLIASHLKLVVTSYVSKCLNIRN